MSFLTGMFNISCSKHMGFPFVLWLSRKSIKQTQILNIFEQKHIAHDVGASSFPLSVGGKASGGCRKSLFSFPFPST